MARMKRGGRVFGVVNGTVLLLIALVCVYPFIYTISVSFSDGRFVSAGRVHLLPKGFTTATYRYIFSSSRLGIVHALLNSVFYTVLGTLVAVSLTYVTAYALSRKRFGGRHAVMMLFLISWIFEAGLVPSYIINQHLGMVNSRLVMIVPTAINTFLLVITRSYLQSLPDELEESASIDGANDLQIMWRIYRPLATPVLATIAIFYASAIWNSVLTPLIYLQNKGLQPIQLLLYNLLIQSNGNTIELETLTIHGHQVTHQNISSAMMVLATIPIVVFYPVAQRYFTKGITIGAIK